MKHDKDCECDECVRMRANAEVFPCPECHQQFINVGDAAVHWTEVHSKDLKDLCHFAGCYEPSTVEVPWPGDDTRFVLPLCDQHHKEMLTVEKE